MKEQLLKIVGKDPAEAVQALKDKGVQVLHRTGDTVIVEGDLPPNLAGEIAGFTRVIAAEPAAGTSAAANDRDLHSLAFRLRQTEAFRRSKLKRVTEGEDWGEIFKRI
jgi:hypothetical protein